MSIFSTIAKAASGAIVAVAFATGIASATPWRLDYIQTDLGNGSHQYDFQLILDNNDNSWTPGSGFDWFIIGDGGVGTPSSFTEGSGFFTSIPDGAASFLSVGGANGPTLGFVDGSVFGARLIPNAVGFSVAFSGVSTFAHTNGTLLWSNVIGSPTRRTVANQVTSFAPAAVPLPAGVILLLGALGAIGFIARRRRPVPA